MWVHCMTIVGERNQDAYCAGSPVFVVADGMGGHCAGDVASREVIEAILPLVGRVPVTGAMLRACLTDARARIARIAVDSGRPPGSTLSGFIATRIDGVPSRVVVNIGDSRTYRLDTDAFRQLTIDHTRRAGAYRRGRDRAVRRRVISCPQPADPCTTRCD
jgi:serine/threonine protein phosphatase PrpC